MSWKNPGGSSETGERNWLPLIVAMAVVVVAGVALLLTMGHGKSGGGIAPVNVAADAYAAKLPLTNIKMSEAGNMAGGKETYIDGQIANNGSETVSGVTVQVLFRNYAHEVVRNESLPMRLIRTRTPYVDIQTISAAPIKPGETREFQLIVEQDIPDWDGTYPELKVIQVETK
jgi:hypothetical protein